MTFRVHIVPEDPTYNGYILKPLAEALFAKAGYAATRITIHQQAGAWGFEAAAEQLVRVLDSYPMVDLFLFLPDRDGQAGRGGGPNRADRLAQLEARARTKGKWLLTCGAVEEVEVWVMAGHTDRLKELGLRWGDVRGEVKPSVGSFQRFLERFGDESVGRGRGRLMAEACRNLAGVLERCPELKELLRRISTADGRPG